MIHGPRAAPSAGAAALCRVSPRRVFPAIETKRCGRRAGSAPRCPIWMEKLLPVDAAPASGFTGTRGAVPARQMILLHLASQSIAVDAKGLGRPGLIPAAGLQHLADILLLKLRHRILKKY